MPVEAEYFEGSGFTRNADDDCTAFGLAYIDLANDVEDPTVGDPDIALGAPATTASLALPALSGGLVELQLSPPGAENTGFAEVSFDLSIATGADLEWLRYDRDGDAFHDDDPLARATFGVFRGPDHLIFIREPWS